MDASKWWSAETVAVVTGGNRGIGMEVCKQLAEKGMKVVLTARDEKRGLAAVHALKEQGLCNVVFHQLDVQDELSVATFASWLSKEQGGLDILISNAGVSGMIFDEQYFKERNIDTVESMFKYVIESEIPEGYVIEYESSKSCIDANYYGTKRVTKALIPLFRPSSQMPRIVTVGSYFGLLQFLPSEKLRQELADLNNVSERYIDNLLDKYLDDVKSKSWEDKAWPRMGPTYILSKLALHTYTRILAKESENRPPSERIIVNCVHPGYVRTDINYNQGPLPVAEGAENVVRIALFPLQDCPSGKFFNEKTQSSF